MRFHTFALAGFLTFSCIFLVACGGDKTATTTHQEGEERLPQPGAVGGSVTGMPNPGKPSALPQPRGELATRNDDPDFSAEDRNEIDQNLPMPTNPPATGNTGEMTLPLPETMPTMPAMPAPAPDPVESRTATPVES